MVTQTAVMALMKLTVMIHVQTTSLLVKISSVSASLGAVMEMMIVVITQMRPSVRILLVLQVGTGQCTYVYMYGYLAAYASESFIHILNYS
jgi:hypothetical protein